MHGGGGVYGRWPKVMPPHPRVHRDRRCRTGIHRPGRAELADLQDHAARLEHLRGDARSLLPEDEDALPRQVVGLDRDGARHVVDTDDAQGGPPFARRARPGDEGLDVGMVVLDLVAVGDHRSAAVPPPLADDVEGRRAHRVGGAHDGADVEVVLPVLDRDVELVPPGGEVGGDRLVRPVAVPVLDIAPVALPQQVRVEALVIGPRSLPRADAMAHSGRGGRARTIVRGAHGPPP